MCIVNTLGVRPRIIYTRVCSATKDPTIAHAVTAWPPNSSRTKTAAAGPLKVIKLNMFSIFIPLGPAEGGTGGRTGKPPLNMHSGGAAAALWSTGGRANASKLAFVCKHAGEHGGESREYIANLCGCAVNSV